MNVLVTYASRYGSTQQIAQWIVERFPKEATVDLMEVSQVTTLDPYTHVIIGSPMYEDNILKEVQRFITTNQEALSARVVGVFAVALVHIGEALYGDEEGVCFDRFDRYLERRPLYAKLLAGALHPEKLTKEDYDLLYDYYQQKGCLDVPYEQRTDKSAAWKYTEKFLQAVAVREKLKERLGG